ncbi:MAG: hypothetical protein WC755_05685 [Candidatus Woesearchaeota archaeon]|jgi:hypothetical protein
MDTKGRELLKVMFTQKHVGEIFYDVKKILLSLDIVNNESDVSLVVFPKNYLDEQLFHFEKFCFVSIHVAATNNIFEKDFRIFIKPDNKNNVRSLSVRFQIGEKGQGFLEKEEDDSMASWDVEKIFEVELHDLEFHLKDKLIELKSRKLNGVLEDSFLC